MSPSGRGTSRLGWWRSPWGTKILLPAGRASPGVIAHGPVSAEEKAEATRYLRSNQAMCQGRWKQPGQVSRQLGQLIASCELPES